MSEHPDEPLLVEWRILADGSRQYRVFCRSCKRPLPWARVGPATCEDCARTPKRLMPVLAALDRMDK